MRSSRWLCTLISITLALGACSGNESSRGPHAEQNGMGVAFEGDVTRTRHVYKESKQGNLDLFEYATPRVGDELRPAIVLFHGGRWEDGHPKQFQLHCIRLAQRGFVAISADYRVEFTHGTSPIEAIYDAKDAIRWVRDHAQELGIDPTRVAAGGGSAGGHISAAAATIPNLSEGTSTTNARPDALVLFSGLVDMTPRDGLGYAKLGEGVEAASPLHHLDGDEPPTLILHGAHDDVASIVGARSFAETLQTSGVRCDLVVYDAGHGFFNEFLDPEAFADTLRRTEHFFEALGWIKSEGGSSRPHIVVILADDLGAGDLGAYNSASKIPTPHMDRIAQAGIRFTDAHSPSAVCTPTRYGLLTGRYAWRSRLKSWVLNGYSPYLIDPERATLASLCRDSGYHTKVIGKWHLGLGDGEVTNYDTPLHPGALDMGFDEALLIPASLDMPPYLWVDGDAPELAPTDEVKGSKHRRQEGGGFWRKGAAAPNFDFDDVLPRIGREAATTIREHGREDSDKPLFLYVPLTAPHTPWLPSESFRGTSGAGYYGDFVAQVDATIGAVTSALDESGMARDTLLIVTSDNGSHWPTSDIERFGHDAHMGRRGQKADIWEGGHRVPLLARWPERIAPNSASDELVALTDLFATLGALLDRPLDPASEGEDSFDILPLLLGRPGAKTPHDSLVLHSGAGVFALRVGQWKLIEGLGSGGFSKPKKVDAIEGGPTGQLYDLASDPAESKNLWLDQPERVAEMRGILDDLRAATGSR